MKDKWDELFDHLKEEDILRNLPEDLPEMEDELAAKRIETRVQEEIKTDMDRQKKQSRKRILAAVVCCIVAIGAFGHKPILAAFQRLFYDLPGVGVYIDEENKTIYEVQIDEPVREKDGVRVELKNFYCADRVIYGEIRITGENVGRLPDGSWITRDDKEYSDLLEDKFKVTSYIGEEKRECHPNGTGTTSDDNGKIERFDMEFKRIGFYLPEGIDTCDLEVAGVNERFTLKIAESKMTENPEELGYSVTKNDTTVVARASMAGENAIDLEYFVFPSEEVKQAKERWYRFGITIAAYEFDYENYFYIANANGERMKGKYESIANGGKYHLQGTEENFPLTLHYSPFTGTDGEEHSLSMPLPAKGEKQTEDLPTVEFHYGTVEILSVEQEDVIWEDTNELSDRREEATKVTITYQAVPKDGIRKMYAVNMELAEEEERFGGTSRDGEENGSLFVMQSTYYLPRAERESLRFDLSDPSYWIEGAYDIVIEKPMEKK